MVNKQIGDLYNVTVNGESRYVPKEDVLIINGDLPETNHQLESFLPLFPKEFADAYQYFFSFMNFDADEVKASIKEKPKERQNVLQFANYCAKYILNQENIAKSITISNINLASSDLDVLSQSVFSVEDQYYYFNTEEFTILMDVMSKELTFAVKGH